MTIHRPKGGPRPASRAPSPKTVADPDFARRMRERRGEPEPTIPVVRSTVDGERLGFVTVDELREAMGLRPFRYRTCSTCGESHEVKITKAGNEYIPCACLMLRQRVRGEVEQRVEELRKLAYENEFYTDDTGVDDAVERGSADLIVVGKGYR